MILSLTLLCSFSAGEVADLAEWVITRTKENAPTKAEA